jgi:hypothetical protein
MFRLRNITVDPDVKKLVKGKLTFIECHLVSWAKILKEFIKTVSYKV